METFFLAVGLIGTGVGIIAVICWAIDLHKKATYAAAGLDALLEHFGYELSDVASIIHVEKAHGKD